MNEVKWPSIKNSKNEEIEGWFDFFLLYDEMVNKFDKATFIEIGTWKGRSTVYMARKIKESGKDIKLYANDIFGPYMSDGKQEDSTDIYDEFIENIEPYKSIVRPIKGDSSIAARQFKDKSVDFIFIDGGHDYEVVLKDIQSWYPKLKDGGVFGGHDWGWEGVMKAVNEYFGDSFNLRGQTWLINYK